MKITKTITRTYNIYDCAKWGMTATETIKKRKEKSMSVKGLGKCFKRHKNMFVCKDCARKVNKDRVED